MLCFPWFFLELTHILCLKGQEDRTGGVSTLSRASLLGNFALLKHILHANTDDVVCVCMIYVHMF